MLSTAPQDTDQSAQTPAPVEIPIIDGSVNPLWTCACLLFALTCFNGQRRAKQQATNSQTIVAKQGKEITRLTEENKHLREELANAKRCPLPAWFDTSQHHNVAGLCKAIDTQSKTIKELEATIESQAGHLKEQRNKNLVRAGYIVLCSRLLGEALSIVKTIEPDQEITRWTGAVVALSKKLQPFLNSYKASQEQHQPSQQNSQPRQEKTS